MEHYAGLLTQSKFRHGICYIYLLYLFLTVSFYVYAPLLTPNTVIFFIQFYLTSGTLWGVYLGTRLKGRQLFVLIFIYQLISSFLLRFLFEIYYGNPFGYDPMDSAYYHEQAQLLKELSFDETLKYLDANDVDFDDWGMILIQRFVYLIGYTEQLGLSLALLVNSLTITLSSYLFYRLSILFLSDWNSKFLVLLWGFLPVAVRVSAIGTKENYFSVFVLGTMYYSYKYFTNRSINSFLLFCFCCIGIYAFRYALSFMMVLSFLFGIICFSEYTRRFLPLIIATGLCISIGGFFIIVEYIGEILGKGWVTTALEYQLSNSSQSPLITMAVNILGGIIGPFPNFIGTEDKTHTFIYIATPLMKLCFSYFYLLGIYYIIRDKKYEYYPLLLFTALNTVMIIFTYFSLVIRYSLPHMPMMMIISAYGYIQYKQNKVNRYYYWGYLAFVIAIIVVFNLRSM